jgi:signal transduction histidine kinase/AmiR/NasT family two-component response regulator
MAIWRKACLVLVGAISVALAAAGPSSAAMSPSAFATALEKRAQGASFDQLRRFGDAAMRGHDRESLRRLHYVAAVFRSQSEFELADRYIQAMARNAALQNDARYVALARLDVLAGRARVGEASVIAEVEKAQASETDWYARAFAQTLWARFLLDQGRTGDALKLLSHAETLIPEGDADAAPAESTIWRVIGLALMNLNDMEGATRAFERSEFEFANPAYPRPDFDAIYNLGHVAINLGDKASAQKLVAVHHRLTERSDLPRLRGWDVNLCGMEAEAFEGPRQVLDCFSGLDAKLTGLESLAPRLLPMRAIAETRLGDLRAAHADLARLEVLRRTNVLAKASFERIPEVEIELMAAEGRGAEAFRRLQARTREQRFLDARDVYGSVRQITGSLETQLASARRQTALEAQAVQAQRTLILLSVLLGCGAVIVLVLQRRGAIRLRAAQNRAEAASAAKSTFLATMSHEIRTPLNGVLGMAQAMAADGLPDDQRERLDIIRQSGESLLAILNDILDLSKIEAGKLELELVEFDLADVARGAHSTFTALANKKGLSFCLDTEAGRGRYLGDPVRLRQILYNLIWNALKFTEEGEIRVSARYGDGVLSIAVADTGIGIAPENQSKLFMKFDQLDSATTRRFGGTGLGLAICQELVQLMGGAIRVESKLGVGSCFTVEFPLTRLGDGTTEAAVEEAVEELKAVSLRVLVAEDNQINQLVIKTLLHQMGVDPIVVDNGQAVVEAWEAGAWDVILMDVQMPVMDGVTAAALIRQKETASGRPRTRIIALSANAMAHQVSQYAAAGMDGHIAKPIEAAALYNALCDAVEAVEPEQRMAG